MRFRLLTTLACLLASLVLAPVAPASLKMYIGAAEDEGRSADAAVAIAKMKLARAAGFEAIRVTAIWETGQTAVPATQLAALREVAAAGDFNGIKVVATIMPAGSRVTPLTATARRQFARFTADVIRRTTIREVIVGNEPNLNRYWLPQFGPNGEDVAAIGYEALLAQAYDAIKAVDRRTFVIGGSVSPRGGDDPTSIRHTHSPTAFITDMGAAYRASRRKKPIMDGFAFHPYGESSSTPPTFAHPRSTSIGLADYGKLVSLLGKAFDGTRQLGSKLPIVYDEYGVDSRIPPAKAPLYHGREPTTTRPVPESVQAGYYAQALMLAACQPTVRGFLIFHVTDETDFNRWQSGLYYADGTPKTSRAPVKDAIQQVREGAVDCTVTGHADDGWTIDTGSPPRNPTKGKPGPKKAAKPRPKKAKPVDPADAWVQVSPFH
jgi:hypothetical protein